MALRKEHVSVRGYPVLPFLATIFAVCLHLPHVSGQIIRSLAQPTLLQTNGLGFQNSDPSSFVLDVGGQNSATLGFGGQTFVNPALISNSAGRFPTINGAGGASTLNGYPRMPQQYQELYTAIGIDSFDPNSQVRLTVTERFNNPRFSSFDTPTDWYVQGTFLNSQLKNKAGSYYVVLTSGGRTADGCDGNTLGTVVGNVYDTQNRFNQFQNSNMPSGLLPNQLLMGASGPTVYASTLEGISRRQLVGGAIAACQSINNGLCSGYIPFCATISKDLFPAMEVPIEHQELATPTPGPNVVPFAVSGVNTEGGIGGGIGQNLPNLQTLPNLQNLPNLNVNTGGTLGLALTDPTAFSNNDPPASREESSPTSDLGLFA